MSYNGSGTFLINTAGQPVVSGTVISSTAFNALTADLATGLSTAITKDGQTTVTANIPMSTYKFTGLGAGSAAADSANLSQVQSTVVKLLASVSGTDTITAVGSPTVAAYAAGQMFYFVAAGDNTGAVTINIDSLGAKAVTRDGSVALAAGDIKSGEVVVVVYDGTRFQVVSQLNSSGDARFANVSIASALNVGGVATVTGGAVLNGGVVINEPGADVDFRVEGDTDANLIFADASTDRVGVGTSSPASKLTVSGDIQILSTNYLSFSNTAQQTYVRAAATNTLAFGTDSTERLRIDSSGNLGLGVTPSAWESVRKVIQISGGAYIAGRTDINQTVIGNNAFSDGTFKYVANGFATGYEQSGGGHFWYTAPSGTAGNAITFTQAMTLDASGNLGIGTTSPTERLHIYKASSNVRIRMAADSGYSASLTLVGNSREAYVYNSDGDLNLYNNYASGNIIFYTNGNNERARITSGGYFKASNAGTYVSSTGTYHEFRNTDLSPALWLSATNASYNSSILEIRASRNTTNASFYAIEYYNDGAAAGKFLVADSGNVTNTNGSYGTISDAKMKTDIVDANSQWADIKGLRFRKFKMKDDPVGLTQLGVVAQEVEQVSPGLVEEHADFEEVEVTDDEGNVKKERQPTGTTTKSVKTSVLLMKAAVALQEAMARIEKLEAEVAALKGA